MRATLYLPFGGLPGRIICDGETPMRRFLSVDTAGRPERAKRKREQAKHAAKKSSVEKFQVRVQRTSFLEFFKKCQLCHVREQKSNNNQREANDEAYNCCLQRGSIDRWPYFVERSKNARRSATIQKTEDLKAFDRDADHRFISFRLLLIREVACHVYPSFNLGVIVS